MASDVAFTHNDDYLVCDECGKPCIFGDCPDHGPLEWIDDSQSQQTPARASLPSNLYLMPSTVRQDQMGVFARVRIEKRVMFGPFIGQKIPVKETHFGDDLNHMYMWDVLKGGKVSHIVDGTDEQQSNWMRFVNCARDNKEQNLAAMQFRGDIYYKTCVPVEAGSELLVWYQDGCAATMESAAQKDQIGHGLTCDVCGLAFAGSTFLLRHKSVRCPGISGASDRANIPQSLRKEDLAVPSDYVDESRSVEKGAAIDDDHVMPSVVEPAESVDMGTSVEEGSAMSSGHADKPQSLDTGTSIGDDSTMPFDAEAEPRHVGDGTSIGNDSALPVYCADVPHSLDQETSFVEDSTMPFDRAEPESSIDDGSTMPSDRGDESRSLDKGASVNEESAMPSVAEAESSYVVVHIGPTSENTTVTCIEAEEGSPYVVVHVQPAPSSDEVPNAKRGKRTLPDTKEANSRKTSKFANAGQGSTDGVEKAKKVVSKEHSTQPRRRSPLKVTKARNAVAKRSSPKRTGTKRKMASNANGSKPSKSRPRAVEKSKVPSSRKKSKSKSTKDEAIEEESTEKTTAKSRKKVMTTTKDKSNSASSRKRSSANMEGTGGEEESAEKQSPNKSSCTAKKPKVRKSEGNPTEPPKETAFTTTSPVAKSKRTTKEPVEKPVTCDICSKKFKWKSQLRYHMRSHAPEKQFKCTFCNKGLSQMSSLKRHLRVHKGEKPHQCQECGKRFLEKAKLNVHQRKHAGELPEKKYKCTVCGRGFTLSANMRSHMRTHTGEKPYPCPQCDKAFKRSSDIASHLRSHTGERPYQCSHCPKAFTMLSHRNRHELIHSGEKPFKCDLCGKGFTQPNSVKAHLKVHAKKQVRLEAGQGDTAQRQNESAVGGAARKTAGVNAPQTEISQSSRSDDLPVTSAQSNGTGEVARSEETSTESLQIARTQTIETEILQLRIDHAGDSTSSGLSDLFQSDTTQVLQAEHLHLGNVQVATQEMSSRDGTELTTISPAQIQLSCTNEQFDVVTSQLNEKELLPPGNNYEHQQIAPAQNSGQEHVIQRGETTLLAL